MRMRAAAAAGGALLLAAALAACSKTTEDPNSGPDIDRAQTGSIATDPKDSRGPAAEVPGAQKGGTIYVIRETKISHMDPQRAYSFIGLLTASSLYARSLTYWKDTGDGKLTLVGDLADNTGTDVNSDCKTWEYKLKDGLKFEDGRAITSKEVAYGIARAFDPDLGGGPTYVQEWLVNDPQFDSKWDFKANKTSLPPGLSTPDAKTVRFEFAKPHCELPFAVSLPYTAPLPPDKDTGVNLDQQPFSSGPYKLVKNTVGVELVFERNPNWDPATDPIRHQYPEKFVYAFGPDPDAAANRIVADNGNDQYAIAWNGIPGSLAGKFASDPALKARTVSSPTPVAWRLSINTARVTDVNVRRALNYAIDRDGLIKTYGGADVAAPITTLMPPGTLGYQKYDEYPAGPTGNVDKAKELLGGKTPELVLAMGDDSGAQEMSTQLKGNLEKAGFKITVKYLPADAKDDEVSKRNSPYDLYINQWSADWPSGASILPLLYDGRTIRDQDNNNTSFLNDPALGAEFDRILALPADQQAAEWAKLDQRIMKEDAPAVPLFVDVANTPTGSKVGGVFISSVFGVPSLVNTYAKQ